MSREEVKADALGLLTLAVLAGLVARLVAITYGISAAIWSWSLCFPILAVWGLVAWHKRDLPTGTGEQLGFALISIPMGAVSFAIDAMISTTLYPQLPFRYAIWHAGSPFGIVLTIAICPGFTLVALAGAARAVFYKSPVTSSGETWIPLSFGLAQWKSTRSRQEDDER